MALDSPAYVQWSPHRSLRVLGGLMRRLIMTEESIHRAVAEWVVLNETRWPALKLMFHAPNGGSRHPAEAAKFKAMLVRKGVPDLMLPVPRAKKVGLAIELKSEKGRISAEQSEFMERLDANGWYCSVCRTPEDAIERIAGYLSIT